MSVPIYERCNKDWRKVGEYIVARLGTKIKYKDKFIEWFMMSEHYHPQHFLFFDYAMYLHLYQVYMTLHSSGDQHHILCVTGKIGKGKSTLAEQCAALVDPSFDMSRVCYTPTQFFRTIRTLKRGQAILIDEGGNFFKALNASTKIGKNLSQYFQMVRKKGLLIVICYDEFEKMLKDIRTKVDSILYKIVNQKEDGDRKFKGYVGFTPNAVKAINHEYIKEPLPLDHWKIQRYISWRGYNDKEFAILNDVSREAYENHKMRAINSYEDMFLEEITESMGDIDNNHLQIQEPLKEEFLFKDNKEVRLVKVTEAKRILGLSRDVIVEMIQDGRILGKKLGGNYVIPNYELDRLMRV